MLTLLLLLLLTVMPHPVAQTNGHLPFPPEHPETLFGSDIEILDTQLSSSHIPTGSNVNLSQTYRALFTDGSIYDLPPAFPMRDENDPLYVRYEVTRIEDQVYLVEIDYKEGSFIGSWRLDLITSAWTTLNAVPEQVETSCGVLPYGSYPPGEWVFITERNSQRHACQLGTACLTPPLPDGFTDWEILSQTPYFDHLLLTAQPPDATDQQIVFAFNHISGELFNVGTFTRQERLAIAPIDTSQLIQITTYPADANYDNPVYSTYWVDLPARTLHSTPFNDYLYYRPNPPRIESIRSVNGDVECQVTVTDPATWTSSTYTVSAACENYINGADGFDYYRSINPERTAAAILQVNPVSGESTEFYRGEIEKLLWVSPDGQYFAAVIDNDGEINTIIEGPFQERGSYGAEFQLIRHADAAVVFSTPAYTGGYTDQWQPWVAVSRNSIIGLSDDYNSSQLVHFTADDTTSYTLEGRIFGALRFDEWIGVSNSEGLYLYNLDSDESVQLLDLGAYDESIHWGVDSFTYLGDSTFNIMLMSNGDFYNATGSIPPLFNQVTYTVRVRASVGN